MTTDSWHRRRSAFNHDWLKNVYSTSLDKWINVLDGRVEDEEFATRFPRGRLLEWADRRTDLQALLDDFYREMSPDPLFRAGPLDALDQGTAEWLRPLVCELWIARGGVDRLLIDVREASAAVDEAFEAAREAIPLRGDEWRSMVPRRDLFSELHLRCVELGRRVSSLPRKRAVV